MSYNSALKAAAHAKLGGKCVKCGFSDSRALQIDHVYGGGGKENRRIGSVTLYRKILLGDPGYQLLCANCNSIKRFENHEQTKNSETEAERILMEAGMKKIMQDSPLCEQGRTPVCGKCGSKELVVHQRYRGKMTDDFVVGKYTCKACGFEGWYKQEPLVKANQ